MVNKGCMYSGLACAPLHVKIGEASFGSRGDGYEKTDFLYFLAKPPSGKGGYKRRKSGRERQCRVSEDRVRLGVSP